MRFFVLAMLLTMWALMACACTPGEYPATRSSAIVLDPYAWRCNAWVEQAGKIECRSYVRGGL